MKKLLTIACAAIAALSFNSCNTADENDAFKTAVAERITKSSEAPAAADTSKFKKPTFKKTVYAGTKQEVMDFVKSVNRSIAMGGHRLFKC